MTEVKSKFKPGVSVRILSAPDRVGVLEKIVSDDPRKIRWLVRFPDGPQRLPERNLELITGDETTESEINNGHFGTIESLRLAITGARLSGKLADVVYSMGATNTEFFSYQFKPVLNFLESPSNGVLIADEVGLGKTIEAGLIWTELRAREDARRLLVVCPAVLREKWQLELRKRFGVNATIETPRSLHGIVNEVVKGERDSFAAIASMQGLRPPKNWRDSTPGSASADLAKLLTEHGVDSPLFDLVIVDEAHYLRNESSQTHQLGRILREASKQMVFLSATPIHLGSRDLFNLLNILDSENFQVKESFDRVLRVNGPLVRLADQARFKNIEVADAIATLESTQNNYLMRDNRQLKAVLDDLKSIESDVIAEPNQRVALADRLDNINLLARVVNRTRKRDVQANRVIREPIALNVPMTAIEANLYNDVTEEVRRYCEEYDLNPGFLVCTPQRQMCSSIPAALRSWRGRELSELQNDNESELSVADGDILGEEKHGKVLFGRLVQFAQSESLIRELEAGDSKFKSLATEIGRYFRLNPGEKVIIFSYFRETLRYLEERLTIEGYSPLLLMGGMNSSKEQIVELFKTSSKHQILLASEVLSEGVDLQFCSTLVNYDLPWNPMRVEQRIGRIDRIGQQKSKINIWNFFYQETLDDRVYRRLLSRLDIFRHALGDLEAVVGEKVSELTSDLLGHALSAEQEEERIDQTAAALEQEKIEADRLEEGATELHAYSDYILRRVDAARDLKRYLQPNDLFLYVKTFLEEQYPGCNLVTESDDALTVQINLSRTARVDFTHYCDDTNQRGSSRLLRSDESSLQRYLFAQKVDFSAPNQEVINQSHPLIRWISSKLSAEDTFATPFVAVEVEASNSEVSVSPGIYVFHVKRFSFSGAKTTERLMYSLQKAESESMESAESAERTILTTMAQGSSWFSAEALIDKGRITKLHETLENHLDEVFDKDLSNAQIQNDDRIDRIIRSLEERTVTRVERVQSTIEKLKLGQNQSLIPAFEGQIKAARDRFDVEVAKFKKLRTINGDPRNVISGVINVKA